MDIPLSTDDIRKITGENNPVILYTELPKYKSIYDIFKKFGTDNFILLYTTSFNYGHWCCCFILPNKDIEFYDPYGGHPDDRMDAMNDFFKINKIKFYPYLSKLLFNTPENINIHFNQFQHQKYDPKIATCGRHVGCRLLHRNYNIDSYSKIFGTKYIDKKITEYTNNFF